MYIFYEFYAFHTLLKDIILSHENVQYIFSYNYAKHIPIALYNRNGLIYYVNKVQFL